jgi:hypothetical protein
MEVLAGVQLNSINVRRGVWSLLSNKITGVCFIQLNSIGDRQVLAGVSFIQYRCEMWISIDTKKIQNSKPTLYSTVLWQ